jgi:hypothetical protein
MTVGGERPMDLDDWIDGDAARARPPTASPQHDAQLGAITRASGNG